MRLFALLNGEILKLSPKMAVLTSVQRGGGSIDMEITTVLYHWRARTALFPCSSPVIPFSSISCYLRLSPPENVVASPVRSTCASG